MEALKVRGEVTASTCSSVSMCLLIIVQVAKGLKVRGEVTASTCSSVSMCLLIIVQVAEAKGGLDLKPTKLEYIFVAVITSPPPPPPPFLLCKYF